MKLNNPLPQTLPKECIKAAKIFEAFVDSGNNGLDGVIPRSVLEHAKGFAIFTLVKAGFVFSARAGSGIVIARLEDGSWSAPSAIGTAGVGVGGQLGAEMTDFLIVLNSQAAINTFMSAGSLTLGGNMSIALGPLGRNSEAIGTVNTKGKMAAMYSYSKSRGLFGGISVEGSMIVERQDANADAYQSPVTTKILLGGMVPPPPWAKPLIATLEARTGVPGVKKWIDDRADAQRNSGQRDSGYAFEFGGGSGGNTPTGGMSVPNFLQSTPSFLKKKKSGPKPTFPPPSWGRVKDSGSYFVTEPEHLSAPPFDTQFHSDITLDGPGHSSSATLPSSSRHGPSRSASQPLFSGHQKRSSTIEELLESPNEFDFSKSSRNIGAVTSNSTPSSNTPHAHSNSLSSHFTASPGYPQTRAYTIPVSPNLPATSSSTIPPSPQHAFSSGSNSTNPFSSSSTSLNLRPAAALNRQSSDHEHDRAGHRRDGSGHSGKFITPKLELSKPLLPGEGLARAIALYDYDAVESGDLSFTKGSIITITNKSESVDDWWTGKINGKEGIFPANFVEIV
ncbi:DUF500-domain-containing protein [Pluteus cervinus]|uniref:DUF500-domain-containing protein n=1 Tax=Pluteus cervinus TaxID=181527 RepID=A0ACD3BGE6_9AGAR|nr:DUF500-domain-containing protein [Pluteus cervinus]